MREAYKSFKSIIKRQVSQFPPRFEWETGSTLEFKSYDRDSSLYGAGYKGIGLDEACLASEAIYTQCIGPMTADTDGIVYLTSNFQRGKDYFYDLAMYGQTEEAHNNRIYSWLIKSEEGLAFQGIEGKKKLDWFKRTLPPLVYAAQFENQPLCGENSVFRWTPEKNEKGVPLAAPKDTDTAYILGLDLGKVVDNSYAVVIECPKDLAAPAQVVWCERFPLGISYGAQANRAVEIAKHWNNAVTVADDTGSHGGTAVSKEPFFKKFKAAFDASKLTLKSYTWNQFSKFRIINQLAMEIDEGRLLIPKPELHSMFTDLVNQVRIYTFKETQNFIVYQAPDGEHDDGVSALSMACWGKVSNWGRLGNNNNNIMMNLL